MKTSKAKLFSAVAILILIACYPAVGRDAKTMTLHTPASVVGTTLAPGEYQVSWNAKTPEPTVTFRLNKKVVAEAKGKLVDHGAKYSRNGVVAVSGSDGSSRISEIRFAGNRQALVLEQPASEVLATGSASRSSAQSATEAGSNSGGAATIDGRPSPTGPRVSHN
jgi:hypothetical protein